MSNDLAYTTEEVAKLLRVNRLTVYTLIKRGELPAYRIGSRRFRVDAAEIERYITKAKGRTADEPPKSPFPVADPRLAPDQFIIAGEDIILDILAGYLGKVRPQTQILRHHINGLAGLMALYQGQVNAVAIHLWDRETDSYNLPYVRRLLPGNRMVIINLAAQREGFYVAKGNPRGLSTWQDLTRPGVRFINRELGSGPRVLLDEKLQILALNAGEITGYGDVKTSSLTVAACVARGDADVGLGSEAAIRQIAGIDFISLQTERYDLVLPQEDTAKPGFKFLLSILAANRFHRELDCLDCYDLTNTGTIIGET